MSRFIEPPYEKVEHNRYTHLRNVAVNIENVDGLKKDTYYIYPDTVGIPILLFLGTKKNIVNNDMLNIKWYFNNIHDMEHVYKGLISGDYNWFNGGIIHDNKS